MSCCRGQPQMSKASPSYTGWAATAGAPCPVVGLQPGGPGVVIPAVFPRAVTGVAHTDLGGHLPLAQPALLAPLQRPSLARVRCSCEGSAAAGPGVREVP